MAKITRIMVAPLAVNCYIIATEQHNAVAIDAGGSVPKILQFLQDNGLTLQKILLTHGHYDHIGGVAELQAATGAEVYIHEADAPMLSHSNLNLDKRFPCPAYTGTHQRRCLLSVRPDTLYGRYPVPLLSGQNGFSGRQ